MRKNFSIGASFAFAAALCLAQGANAATANFNDIPAPPAPSLYTHFTNSFYDGGLHFNDNEFDVLQAGVDPLLTGQTSAVMETGNSTAIEPLTISAYSGTVAHNAPNGAATAIDFNLWYLKLGLGYLSTGSTDTVTVSGFAAGGCDPLLNPTTCQASISQTFDVTSALTLEALTGFTNLAWVQIGQPLLSDGKTIDPGWLAVDDLVYTPFVPTTGDQVNPGPPAADPTTGGVPEPSVWALMILGFGGVGAAVRRRRRAGLAAA